MGKLKLWSTVCLNIIIRCIFRGACILPVNEKKICFASIRGEELKGNLLFINKELQRRDLAYTYVYLLEQPKHGIRGKIKSIFQMLRASYHLATARFFLIDDYYYPVYIIKPRKGTEIIQLWHAAGAFKKFGYSTVGKTFGPSEGYLKHVKVHSNYTYALVSSRKVVPCYAEAFNMSEEKVLPLGVPRLDYFHNVSWEQEKENFYKVFPELRSKKLILYAPTYRGNSLNQQKYKSEIDFGQLYKQIGDQFSILVHLHPYITEGLELETDYENFIYEIDREFTIEELMIISDILITDYSSVIFDYSLLLKPIIFFAPDLNEYIKERDFYYEYKSFIPGPLFNDSEAMGYYIRELKFSKESVEEFRRDFFEYIDGNNSKRIVDTLIKGS